MISEQWLFRLTATTLELWEEVDVTKTNNSKSNLHVYGGDEGGKQYIRKKEL